MSSQPEPDFASPDESTQHVRRKRYSGKNPRRFEDRYKELDPQSHPEIHEHILAQGKTPAGTHIPIMVEEVMGELRPSGGEFVLDCTVGYGGHATEFLKRIGPSGRLVGCDVDGAQLERTRGRLTVIGSNVSLHRMPFTGIAKVLREEGIEGFDVIFADLGVSSMQIDDPARGFSYKHDGPLDMRMDDRTKKSAADLLAELPEAGISSALHELADEPDHERLARHIVRCREKEPIRTTRDLVRIILEAKGVSRKSLRSDPSEQELPDSSESSGSLHPAARTFQALRILVNNELDALTQLLRLAPYGLNPGGRLGIISFHSGEDRLVKKSFQEGLKSGRFQSVSDKPIRPTLAEVRANPRSSSARFRVAIRA